MAIKTQGAMLLVKKDPDTEKVYAGGIVIRAGAIYDRLVPATVVDIGPKCKRLNLKKGDRILVGCYTGTLVKVDDEDHYFIREFDAQAKIEDDSNGNV